MSAHVHPRLTEEQYLELERASPERHEFYDGHMYAMSGASSRHGRIIHNLNRELGIALKDRPCLITSSDLRVRIQPRGLYAYPDIVITCSEPQYVDGMFDTLLNPSLIIEVLSPSTESYDRGFKFAQYRKIESLQEYVLVSQKEARVEVFRRQPEGAWLFLETAGMDGSCDLMNIDCTIPLREIYHQVAFEEAPDSFPPPGAVR